MLKPSMQELLRRVGNRYLLVNLAAQRARDLADQAEQSEEPLEDKAVKLALDEIAKGKIIYRPGPRTTPIIPQNNAVASAIIDVGDSEISDDEEELTSDVEDTGEDGFPLEEDEPRRLDEFDNTELDDGDVPVEDR